MAHIKDKNGRRFWFDPKWTKEMVEQITQQK